MEIDEKTFHRFHNLNVLVLSDNRLQSIKEVWAPQCASYSAHQHTTVSTNQIALNTDRSSVLSLAKQLLRSVSCKQWTRSVRIPHSHTIRMPLHCSDLLLCVRSDWRVLLDNTVWVGDRGNDVFRVFHLIKNSNARKLTRWAPIFFRSNDWKIFFYICMRFLKKFWRFKLIEIVVYSSKLLP